MDDPAKTTEDSGTELEAVRERLRSMEARYQSLLASRADAVLIFDFDGTAGVEQSARARKLFGYSDEEFRALKPRDLTTSAQRAEIAMMMSQLHTMGRARRPRLRLRRKDGSEFWGDVSATVFEEQGRRRQMHVVRDITPAIEHETKLSQQKELLQMVFDHIPVMALLFTDQRRARFINREAELVLGWSLDEWQREDVLSACFPDPDVYERATLLLQKTPSRWVELTTCTRFGRFIDTMWYGLALPGGETLTIAQDVTAQKDAGREVRLLEDRLRRKQKLEALGTLAAGVAHEINNPLTWLMGNVECLKALLDDHASMLASSMTDELGEIVVEMRDGTERIRRIVAGLKPFTRSDEDTFGPVDLIQVLDTAVDLAGNEIRHRARLVRRIRKVPPVYGNQARLTQAFVNLLVNAAQAISHGHATDNRIRIVTSQREDGRVCVIVEDTGVGIPATVIDRIFEPFFTTRAPERTGLGLSICHSIIDSCGGEIEVTSSPGAGTRFCVYLLASAEPLIEVPSPDTEEPLRPARVLVIDDEPNVCQILRRALRDHHVAVAHTGRDAMMRLNEASFDIILCDVMMPDVSGMDVFQELSELHPAQARRMVFMTGGAFTDAARAFLADTRNPVLQKPVNLGDLRTLVRRAVRPSPSVTEDDTPLSLPQLDSDLRPIDPERRRRQHDLAGNEPVGGGER